MKFKVDIPETTIMRHEVEAYSEEQAIRIVLDDGGDLNTAPYPVETMLDLDGAKAEPFQEPLNLVGYYTGLMRRHKRIVV